MGKQEIYVISDLHLGGAPGKGGGPGFQMCPPSTHTLMADFISRLPAPTSERDVRLVLAGDIVDFLAEREFNAFTSNESDASSKLDKIMERTAVIWDGLSGFVAQGGALTLLLGNHDIELSLPATRQKLLGRLGTGRIDFIYDNEALTIGPLLIEHGNRYDGWNAVAHGALRRVRSQLSRGESAGEFPEMPGSRMVIEIINPIKEDYSFVDLLKPEDAGVLPILAGLGVGGIGDVWKFLKNYRKMAGVSYGDGQVPAKETYIADIPSEEDALYGLAQDIEAGGDATQVSGIDITGSRDKVSETVRELRRAGLRKAFQSNEMANIHREAFVLTHENSTYLKPAQAAANKGFKVVIYGHTHLVKRVPLENGAVYLNTGTWADLIQVPKAVWGEDKAEAEKTLDQFVNDLEKDEVARWRHSLPTYARVELDGEAVLSAGVYFADTDDAVTDEGIESRFL